MSSPVDISINDLQVPMWSTSDINSALSPPPWARTGGTWVSMLRCDHWLIVDRHPGAMKQQTVLEITTALEIPGRLPQGEVEIDLGGGEAVVAQEALQSWEGDAFLHPSDREWVTEHMGGLRCG
jgi:hypothetical protein